MPPSPLAAVIRHLHRAAGRPASAPPTDRDLLARFALCRDEEAFAELVHRHGRLVEGVSRRVLGNASEAEDVFQATFLVLAKKAGAVGWHDSVANWLYGVAYRLARRAKADACRRAAHERRAAEFAGPAVPPADVDRRELCAVLDEELHRLPAACRLPLLRCYLDGRTRDEAAAELGLTLATLKRRLERGRELLRARLERRGLTLSGVLLAAGLARPADAATPPADVARAAAEFAGVASGPSLRGQELAEGALRMTRLVKLKATVVAVLASGLLAASVGLANLAPGDPTGPVADKPAEAPAANAEAAARRDVYGDPLPAEAVARLGTLRMRHGQSICYVAFTPDGRQLVSQSYDGVRVWDPGTGKEVRRFGGEAGRSCQAACLSPDGRLVAVDGGNPDGSLHLWDLASGKRVRKLSAQRASTGIVFSPDGKRLATLANDGKIELFDAATGERIRAWQAHQERTWAAAFTPDGKHLITGGADKLIRVWDGVTGQKVRETTGNPNEVGALAVSPDGNLLATVGQNVQSGPGWSVWHPDNGVRLWDLATGTKVRELTLPPKETIRGRPDGLSAPVFTPDGKALLTVGTDHTLRVWDPATGIPLRALPGMEGYGARLAVSPDGKTVACADGWLILRIRDLATGKDLLPAGGHRSSLSEVELTADGRRVLTAGYDRTVRVWDPATGREVRRFADGGPDGFALSRDGREVFLVCRDDTLRACDLATGKELRRTPLPHAPFPMPTFAPDRKIYAMTGKDDQCLRVCDTASGKLLATLAPKSPMGQVAGFGPDGRTVYIATQEDSTLRVWDVRAAKELRTFPAGAEDAPRPPGVGGNNLPFSARLSPDGKLIAVGHQDGTVRLLETGAGREVRRLRWPESRSIPALTFSPDGRTLAWGSWEPADVRLWEVATGGLRHELRGHAGRVMRLAFSADGRTLVSGSEDTTALVWDLTGRRAGTVRDGAALSDSDLEARWDDLGGGDAAKAYRAIQVLAADPARSVPFLARHLKPVAPADEARIARLVADLDSESFAVREKAAAELVKLGEAALGGIRKALDGRPAPDVRKRLEALRSQLTPDERNPPASWVRTLRALEVLERIGDEPARRLLAGLAVGAPGASLTREAKAALDRIATR